MCDAVLGTEGAQLALGERGVQLELVDGGDTVPLRRCIALEVRAMEVRDADRAGLAVGLQLLEGEPGLEIAVEIGARPVDEVQVDVVEAELLED